MCEYCHSFPHLEGCPADEPDNYGICKICERAITKGEEYVEVPRGEVHLECLVELVDSSPREALDHLGATCYVAGE